jgi:uncharacterized protein YggU (UPF0235/DUF167 family)
LKIFVKAKPSAKVPSVTKLSGNVYAVAVKEPPVDGRANLAVAAALAKHLGLAKSQVRLIGGATSRQKMFEV